MKRLLITGGSGFVGKNLVEGLEGRYEIFAPTHKELDLLNYEPLKQYIDDNCIDVIIHGAVHVPMFNGEEKEFFNDMQMFWNIEKLSPFVEKVLYFGSGAEYDKRYNITNVTEEQLGTHIPATEYGLAKYTMTKIARKSNNIYNLRLFGVFGKYELWQIKFLSNLCCKTIFDLPLTIRKECLFDFLYIDDLVWIVDQFINITPKYHDYNVCNDNNYLLSELAEMIAEISGKSCNIKLLSSGNNLDYTADNTRLHKELPDLVITPMKSSLEKLYHYYLNNKEIIDFDELKISK